MPELSHAADDVGNNRIRLLFKFLGRTPQPPLMGLPFKVIGWVTSGGYGHFVDRSLAQGYVPRALAADTAEHAFEIEIIGERRPATIIERPLFDPEGLRMRM